MTLNAESRQKNKTKTLREWARLPGASAKFEALLDAPQAPS